MTYSISLISTEESEGLKERYAPGIRYEVKSEIYGCCIKLLCDDHTLKDTWEDNFYSMSQNIRSHGRLYVIGDDTYPPDTVLFDPQVKTAFLVNMPYYGWIKSIALSLAGDILEDEHGIWSMHGACVDVEGRGICIVGTSGSGKTTQTYGLLTSPRTRIISDDWFYSRVYGNDILAYGSEKNFYIQEDLATIWEEF
ncbi:MAG TPA: aldolase, partial [Methanomicrobiales archaeon]|nr:aldolase [Methanomicrobiales archaeon]